MISVDHMWLLEWKRGKGGNPLVRGIRSRLLRPKSMPLNTVVNARDGSSRVVLSEPSGSYAEVSLYGGQVVSWKNERREQLLYMSTKAQMKPPKAIRGGLPICFPQFGNFGALERHGFARNRFWSFDNDPSPLPPANQQSAVDLVLKSTEDDLKIWPHSFELRVRISISPGKLTIIPRVRNTDPKAFSFMFALRNYLYVSDISEVRVEGLETLDYLDNLMRRERFTEQADAITFDGEIDRVYLNTPTKIAIIDHERKRTIELRKEGMPNAVVWNPWDKKAKSIADMGDEDYTTMLCVDSGAIETPILLKPCEEWRGRQELSIVSSSYCSGQLDPRKAQMKPPKAIRGGLPICFPQFGNFGALERHGFARNRFWSFDNDPSPLPPANQQSTVDLVLKSTEDDLKIWPHSFELRVRISISPGKLTIIPRVRNTDPKAFSFMFALRNYLYVSDISEVRVEGLETLDYLDNLMRRERFTEQADAITFDGEIDRVYLNTPTKIAIIDHERKRTIELRKEGMPNAVVWNPWDKKAKSIADMGDEDYTTMLCVDSGAIETPILLKPCEEWRGRQELSIVSSSYCSGQLDPRKVLYGDH
ncbi:hypothetical protein DY000_02000591 [Brassica cretica]|uniref:glucose-6-phosphate 1-epimerase n=1 Tax=Brassica cretica TaxID=69181 RepID=A0ABQ7C5G9_BRACR|nr:hypothetical protein DY000_02000591 [Brassica cretica]